MIGTSAERNASDAEAAASGMASRLTLRRPERLTAAKRTTISTASTGVGTPGRYHWWRAEPESRAVSPQVGTHPHQ